MTLLELLIAMTIMVMVVGAIGTLAKGVQQGFEYTEGHAAATQHARVSLQRMETAVREATANKEFPGAMVLDEWSGPWRFPDTLVVWAEGDPLDVDGSPRRPRYNELRIYCPDWNEPNKLVEITPTDTQTVPWVEGSGVNVAQLTAEIQAIKKSTNRETVALTELMRTCAVDDDADVTQRGAVRFVSRLRPSQDEWDKYVGGGLNWDELAWVQGIFGSQTGLRQAWVRIELQLMPGKEAFTTDPSGQRAIPFLGSAASYYEMSR